MQPEWLLSLDNVQHTESYPLNFKNFEQQAIKKYGLKAYSNEVKVPYASPNLFPMWFGVKSGYQFFKESEECHDYDLICRMRYDNFMLGQFDIDLEKLSDNTVITEKNYSGYGGYGDQFAIGKPNAMENYFNLYDWLTTDFLQKRSIIKGFPEVVLREYLINHCGLNVIERNYGLRLLRPEYVGLPPLEIPLRSHDVSKTRNQAISDRIRQEYPELFAQTEKPKGSISWNAWFLI